MWLTENEIKTNELNALLYFDEFCKAHNIRYYLYAGTLLGAVRHGGYIPWDDDVDVCMTRKELTKLLSCYENKGNRYQLQYFDTVSGYSYPYPKLCDTRTIKYSTDTEVPYKPEEGLDIDIFIIDGYSDSIFIRNLHFNVQLILFEAYRIILRSQYRKDINVIARFILKLIRTIFTPTSAAKLTTNFAGVFSKRRRKQMGCMVGLYRKKMEVSASECFERTSIAVFENHEFPIPYNADIVLKALYGGDYMTLPPVEKRVSTHKSKISWK